MPMPNWTPDGETRSVNKIPAVFDVGTLLMPNHRVVAEMDVSATNGVQQWVVFPETTRLLMVEVV